MIAEMIAKAVLHSSILDRILSAMFDYEEGKITQQEAREELNRIDEEVAHIKESHWSIVNERE